MTTSTPLLTDKVAVVTGAGQGLGRAYALELARQGAAVVVNDIDAQAAQAVVDEITDAGGRAVTAVAPVGPTSTADALVAAAVDNFGRLDVMVTNAGLLRDKVLWKMSDDDFDQVIEVHLRGTFTCARAAAIRLVSEGTAREALVPNLDQTRTVGLVTLPGAFIGVLLGGGSPLQAGAAQILVLVGIMAAQTITVTVAARLVAAAKLLPADLRGQLRP